MFKKQTIKDISLSGKTVLLRADYNVPIASGQITDDYRLRQSLPTINYLLEHKAKLIICSHLGRPDGRVDKAASLTPVAAKLAQLLDREVIMAPDCTGPEVKTLAAKLAPGQILLLENLRFHSEEEANDPKFAKALASLADIFVQDGFGVVHRAHASTEAITKFLPSVAGLLLEKEITTITSVMTNPKRPLMAIIGGAKIDDKIEILKRFIGLADMVAVGGALANPFMVAKGIDVQASLNNSGAVKAAKEIIKLAETEATKRSFSLAIPHDSVVAEQKDKHAKTRVVDFSSNSYADIENYPKPIKLSDIKLSAKEEILDIGPFSAAVIAGAAQLAATVIWNGTMGVTEVAGLEGPVGPFAHGTETVIEALVGDFGAKPFSLVGGGDTVGYIEKRGLSKSFNHVSTGGGASLDLMSGYKLPGLEALADK